MKMLRLATSLLALAVAATLFGQEAAQAPPPSKGFDAQACAKHCQEMAAAHQKAMDAAKAARDKHDAAWKDIKAQLDAARTAKGDKKVAALQAVIEKLLAFHETMMEGGGMGMGPHPMGGHHHGGMDCCAGMGEKMDCCAGMSGGKMDCCAGMDGGAGMAKGEMHCGAEAGGK